jgi:hypothetical protein
MSRQAGIACVAAGAAWLLLVPATVFARSEDLSYDGYFRLMALPLGLFAVGWYLLGRVWQPETLRGRNGWWLVLAGLALAWAGTTLEFWGSWLLGEPTSHEASETGEEAWWGSDLGWTLFLLGFLLLLVGGPTAAVALRRTSRLPFWALAVICVLGFGVFFGNLLRESRLLPALVGLGLFAAGWIGLGVLVRREGPLLWAPRPPLHAPDEERENHFVDEDGGR